MVYRFRLDASILYDMRNIRKNNGLMIVNIAT